MHRSMLETAVTIMKRKRSPQHFSKIFDEVSSELGFTEEEAKENIARFYNDLSLSALFVYTGDNNWDLKERQPADMWDKDASFFIDPEELKARKAQRLAERQAEREARKEIEEIVVLDEVIETKEYDEEDLSYKGDGLDDLIVDEEDDLIDFSSELDEEDLDDEEEDEVETKVETEATESTEESEEYVEDMDEDKYNEIMDDYEDLYDDEK